MSEIIVSIAEFKTHLSRILNESRNLGERIVIVNRKKPVATVVPYLDGVGTVQPGLGGLASIAGGWKELEDIVPHIDKAYISRQGETYREQQFP
jgi:prevent-host-death family protein